MKRLLLSTALVCALSLSTVTATADGGSSQDGKCGQSACGGVITTTDPEPDSFVASLFALFGIRF